MDQTAKRRAGRERSGFGYRDIAAALVAEIRDGRWRINDTLPTEMELVERFGVGRNTVREALRELQELGYIRRRRGTRSVLVMTNPEKSFVNSVRSAEELLDYGRATRATVLTRETVRIDQQLARRLDIEADGEMVRVGILRRREEQAAPFCYSEVYIDPAFSDVIDDFESEGELYTLIERRHGIVIRRVVQDIEAVAVDANISSRLNVPVDSPALLVRTKFYSSDGRLIEIGMVHFPAGRYAVRLRLDRKPLR